MNLKQIHLRIDEDIIRTSNRLKRFALKEEDLTFFRLYTGNKSSWHAYVYQMGVIHIKKEWEKMGKRLSEHE